jgi:Ion channel
MFFAFAYKAVGEFASVPFFGAAGDGSLSQDLFFSFVTMTTVAYGSLVPAANPGQTLAVLEAVTGQLFLVGPSGRSSAACSPDAASDPVPDRATVVHAAKKGSRAPGWNAEGSPGSDDASAYVVMLAWDQRQEPAVIRDGQPSQAPGPGGVAMTVMIDVGPVRSHAACRPGASWG